MRRFASYFGEDDRINATIEKDPCKNMEEALFEVYRKLRPGEPPTIESAQSHINGLFFDARRYDLSRVGRYKYNKKLNLAGRITGQQLLPARSSTRITGEADGGGGPSRLPAKLAKEIDDAGVSVAYVDRETSSEVKVISNGMVDIQKFVTFDAAAECGINEQRSFQRLWRRFWTSAETTRKRSRTRSVPARTN